jgi:hypothetical protein
MRRYVLRRHCRFDRWLITIDSSPLPECTEIDGPWSSNLVMLDTNCINDHQRGVVSQVFLAFNYESECYFYKIAEAKKFPIIDAP